MGAGYLLMTFAARRVRNAMGGLARASEGAHVRCRLEDPGRLLGGAHVGTGGLVVVAGEAEDRLSGVRVKGGKVRLRQGVPIPPLTPRHHVFSAVRPWGLEASLDFFSSLFFFITH